MYKLLQPPYRLYLIIAVLMHLTILAIVTIQPHKPKRVRSVRVVSPQKIVRSNIVARADVDKTIKRLERQEHMRKKRLADEAQIFKSQTAANKKLKQKLAKLKEAKRLRDAKARQEINRLRRIKKQAALLEAKKQREAKLLALKKAKEEQRLKALKREALKVAKRKRQMEEALKRRKEQAALEAKRKALARKREAEALAKREAEAKRQALELARQKAEQEAIAAREHARTLREIERYKAMITAAIARQWLIGDDVNPELTGVLLIRVAQNGTVLSVQLVKSSGHSALDRSARMAVYKASPLAVPAEPTLFNHFRTLRLTFTPRGVLG